jgi:hypothetical protein
VNDGGQDEDDEHAPERLGDSARADETSATPSPGAGPPLPPVPPRPLAANGRPAANGRDDPSRLRVSRRRFLALIGLALAAGAALWEFVRDSGRRLLGIGPSAVPSPSLRPGESAGATEPPGVVGPVETAPIETGPPTGPNRVAHENRLRGSDRWNLPLDHHGDAEGYVDNVSFVAGDTVTLRLRSTIPTVSVTAYRLGWYERKGGRRVAHWPDVQVRTQPAAPTDPQSGMIRCHWEPALAFRIPGDWVSGLYLLLLEPKGAAPGYVPFFVREARNEAPILYVSGITTYQAYNSWGGKSLYSDGSTGAATVSGAANAVTASFDRPYDNYRGGGRLLRWDPQFIRWMESRGFDVAYTADLDLERHADIVQGRRLLVFNGHPEYWSLDMRRTLEAAIGNGVNVAFFTGNEIYWRVRFEDLAGGRFRTVTCYRRAEIDPLAASSPQEATTKWRDQPSPVPESLVVGQMYGHMLKIPADFVCIQPDHWIYEGTGMQAGDTLRNLVGQEYDRFWPDPSFHPDGVELLATSPVDPNYGHAIDIYGSMPPDEPQPPVHNATIYTAASGATVFSAGTMQWSWGLDDWGNQEFEGVHTPVDPRVQRITENVLSRLGK